MKKRWIAALLAIALAFALTPAPVLAAAPAASSAGSRLTGADREVYDCLRREIVKIAQGSRTSTEIAIPDSEGLRWSVKELGAGNSRADVLAKLKEKLGQSLDLDRVYRCLAADLPCELFWMENQYAWGYSLAREGDRAWITSITVQLYAAQDYRGGSRTSTDPAKIAAAGRALENARSIVEKYRDRSDLEKLAGYREEICRLASYNTDAARAGGPYGDPWQLVYVFDGDPATNVVCEGYAKAFKHLCDLSRFDGDVVCRTATGTMNGGAHMWNVVQMGDGENYLVDVTNCDSGTVGADDKLFLVGAERSADGRTYTVSKGRLHAAYTYGEGQEGLFGDGWLILSADSYDPSAAPSGPAPAFSDVEESAYYAQPVAWAVEREITAGTSGTTFSPARTCTHGEILTFLWRAAGRPASDGKAPEGVEQKDFFYDAVRWAAGKGLLGDSFDPASPCTRADAVRYIWRAFDGPDDQVASFSDVPADAPYAPAVGWAVLEGVTTGTSDDTFGPEAICSRGQIVTFLYRAYHIPSRGGPASLGFAAIFGV